MFLLSCPSKWGNGFRKALFLLIQSGLSCPFVMGFSWDSSLASCKISSQGIFFLPDSNPWTANTFSTPPSPPQLHSHIFSACLKCCSIWCEMRIQIKRTLTKKINSSCRRFIKRENLIWLPWRVRQRDYCVIPMHNGLNVGINFEKFEKWFLKGMQSGQGRVIRYEVKAGRALQSWGKEFGFFLQA